MKEIIEQNLSNPEKDMRDRVDKLGDDSVHELILEEDKYRNRRKRSSMKTLLKAGVPKDKIREVLTNNGKRENEEAKLFSDKSLEAKEHEKAKFKDPLTGIGNIGSFNETVPPILNIEKREQKDSAMLMIDIDLFKEVNDKHGHAAGDKTIKEVANIIKDTIRTSDIVFRVGGEEFAVFLPDTDVEGAKVIADKIRENIEEAKIFNRTVSIGCMGTDQLEIWSEKQDKFDMQEIMNDLKKGADKALYLSKNNGRNEVNLYSEELEEKKK